MSAPFSWPQALAGELLGTYLLVLFGTGSVAAAVLTNAQMGLWQVAVVWGFGVTLAIYAAAALSGAHLNPAVSLAFALWRRLSSCGQKTAMETGVWYSPGLL
jgi:glycerol uptake facilitator protein